MTAAGTRSTTSTARCDTRTSNSSDEGEGWTTTRTIWMSSSLVRMGETFWFSVGSSVNERAELYVLEVREVRDES